MGAHPDLKVKRGTNLWFAPRFCASGGGCLFHFQILNEIISALQPTGCGDGKKSER